MRYMRAPQPQAAASGIAHSIRLCEPRLSRGCPAAFHAGSRCRSAVQRNISKRCLRLSLDLRFPLSAPAPGSDNESGSPFHEGFELVVARDSLRVLFTKLERALEQILLDRV